MYDPNLDFDQERLDVLKQLLGVSLVPLSNANDLLGRWAVRFKGPVGSDKVQWLYEFSPDGNVIVEGRAFAFNNICTWKLTGSGVLSLRIPIAPTPNVPTLENGTVEEESYWVFTSADSKVIITNFDASVIQELSRCAV